MANGLDERDMAAYPHGELPREAPAYYDLCGVLRHRSGSLGRDLRLLLQREKGSKEGVREVRRFRGN